MMVEESPATPRRHGLARAKSRDGRVRWRRASPAEGRVPQKVPTVRAPLDHHARHDCPAHHADGTAI